MIVLIPSYKRTEILHWVIRSVVNCDTQGIDERILILVVNNYFPNQQVVDSIVAQFRFERNFSCKIIHREKTLPAVDSWFSAINAIADEDEVVCLLGDDDFLLPWGLKNRYHQIRETQADMLLSDFCQRLFLFEGGEKCWLDSELPELSSVDLPAVPWNYVDGKHPECSFMSNHCYRNTQSFRKGLKTAMSWCQAQAWVPIDFATGNLPLYMAYAIKSSGGSVVVLNEKLVVRGVIVNELLYQDYSDGGNTAFYCLLIYDTFVNKIINTDLQVPNSLLLVYKKAFLAGFTSIFDNKLITVDVLLKTMRHTGIHVKDLFCFEMLSNIRQVMRMIPGIKGYRLKKIAKSNLLQNTATFFQCFSNHKDSK